MSTTPELPPDPKDPEWVNRLMARARARAEAGEFQTPATAAAPQKRVETPDPPRPHRESMAQAASRADATVSGTRPIVATPNPAPRTLHLDPVGSSPRQPPAAATPTVLPAATVDAGAAAVPVAHVDAVEVGAVVDGVEDPAATDDDASSMRNTIEWIAVAAGAILVALLIRTFVFQAFYIPSRPSSRLHRSADRRRTP